MNVAFSLEQLRNAMEGARNLINLAPYFVPEPAPRGAQTRRLTRHSFLSNRWGLQRHRSPLSSVQITRKSPVMPRDKAGLRSIPLSGLSTNGAPIECFESRLNHNFGVLRLEFHQVQDRMRRLERTVEKIPERLTEYMDKALQPLPDMAVVEHMERIHDAEKADLEEKHRRQVESLLEEKADDKAQLEKMELDLQFANMRADIAAKDLAETRLQMEAHARQLSKAGGPGVENPDEVVRAAFLGLRESISDLCRSPALELGPLNDTRHTDGGGADSFCDRETWNRSSPSQRRRRIMAHVFHLLFRRILRSGLRLFGLQAFIKSDENHWISAEEAHLRALEKELEARQGEPLQAFLFPSR